MISAQQPRRLISAVLLGVFLVWVPLPFASVTLTGLVVARVAAFAMLAISVGSLRGRSDLTSIRWPLILLGALGLAGVFQSWAWPPLIASLLSPEHLRLEHQAQQVLAPALDPGWVPLSLAPDASRSAALTLLAVAAVFAAAAVAGRHRNTRRLMVIGLVISALVQVLFGLRSLIAGNPVIWGVQIQGPAGRLRGTFVNPNHLALFLEMVLPVLLAWAWWALDRRREKEGLESRLLHLLPALFLWVLVFVALALTGSRAGLAAAVTGLVVQGVLMTVATGNRRAAILVLVVAVAGLVAAFAVSPQRSFGRLAETTVMDNNLQSRLTVAGLSVEAWKRFPVTGSGLGSFGESFSLVRPPTASRLVWDRAHNDFLELLVTGGLLAAALCAAGVILLCRRLWGLLRLGRRTENRAAALAALGAVASVALHELFDFGLAVPANAFTLAALMGGAAGAHLGLRKRRYRAGEPPPG